MSSLQTPAPPEWHRAAFDMLPVAVTREADGVLLHANDQFAAMLGTSFEEVIGRNIDQVLAQPNAHAALLAGAGRVQQVELQGRRADGTSLAMVASVCRVSSRDEPDVVLCTFRSVSERTRKAEESVELHRLLLNSTGEGIYVIDRRGDCTFANRACLTLLGFKSDAELLGRNMHELVHHTRANGEPYPAEECRIYQALQDRKGTNIDDEVLFRRDGSSFHAEYWSYPVERNGKLVGCVVTFVDITDRRRGEELLAEVARFPDMNPGPVLRLDSEANVLLANTAARSLFGTELAGRCWREVCPD
ncbi:MAG: PAS domain S-box protein, partial [Bacteroidetes bacterium]|nr:PAS domain S-box protein [Bacteroidota bacterium]